MIALLLAATVLVTAAVPAQECRALETRSLSEEETAAVLAVAERWGRVSDVDAYVSESCGIGSADVILEAREVGTACVASILILEGRRRNGDWEWGSASAIRGHLYWPGVDECANVDTASSIYLDTLMDSDTLSEIIRAGPRLFDEAKQTIPGSVEGQFLRVSDIYLQPKDDGLYYEVGLEVRACTSVVAHIRLIDGRPTLQDAFLRVC